jgi:tetratricopeptide (TPR) repeat protein
MTNATTERVRRWQEEVARDPGADAFVPLADLYRAQGRLDAALRVCWRGLQRNPEHVDGHFLLGRIYRDSDEMEKAYDEWDIALGLEPDHLPSLRSIGFLCLERGDFEHAGRYLRRALQLEPDDPRLRRAVARLEGGNGGPSAGSDYWALAAPILDGEIRGFVRATRVRMVLVVDPAGRLVAQHGFAEPLDVPAFATLAAGIQAASGEIARMMGQRGFSQLYQGRGEHQIFLGELATPPGLLLFLTVFGADSPVGLVRELFRELGTALAAADWPPVPGSHAPRNLEAELTEGIERFLRRKAGQRSDGRG